MNAKLSDDDYRVIVDELAFGADTHAGLAEPDRLVTDQRALVGCVALIVLRMTGILFDGPHKVIARFQQVNAVNKTLARVQGHESEQRSGGVIAHARLRQIMIMVPGRLDDGNNAACVGGGPVLDKRLKAHSKTPTLNQRCQYERDWWILSRR